MHANNSRWLSFGTLRCESWRDGNVVLLGDAAHTAHFSIGSGTKLAMEDALALAACLHEQRRPGRGAGRLRGRAPAGRGLHPARRAGQPGVVREPRPVPGQEPEQFAFNIMTRSRRVTHGNLRLRDPEFTERMDAWFAGHVQARRHAARATWSRRCSSRSGCALELTNRVVVSAMDMYSSADGMPSDFHLVHLGGKALGGAGLVMTEMVCVSAEGRITPGCAGMYAPEHEAAWRRITGFVHGTPRRRSGFSSATPAARARPG